MYVHKKNIIYFLLSLLIIVKYLFYNVNYMYLVQFKLAMQDVLLKKYIICEKTVYQYFFS